MVVKALDSQLFGTFEQTSVQVSAVDVPDSLFNKKSCFRYSIAYVPVWRSVFLPGWILERALDKYLSVLPPHHAEIHWLGTVLFNELVHAQMSQYT